MHRVYQAVRACSVELFHTFRRERYRAGAGQGTVW